MSAKEISDEECWICEGDDDVVTLMAYHPNRFLICRGCLQRASESNESTITWKHFE